MTIPEQDTGHLDQPQVVGCLLLIPHQDSPALRKLAQRAHQYLTPPRRVALVARAVKILLPDALDMSVVAKYTHCFLRRRVVVTLVQAQMLRRFFARFGVLYYDRFEGDLKQLGALNVRSGDSYRAHFSFGFNQGAAFDVVFGPVSRIRIYEGLPKRANNKACVRS